ncbi:MAG TPA: LysR family transcriptional regulator [Burkholderiaceae bacterium]|nr:LysR family transcriptional regulator [Burkholderiaceae bacterium]
MDETVGAPSPRPRARAQAGAELPSGLDDLASLRIFARVVELESFSEAARRVGVSPSTVSKHIAALEDQLGTRLVNRTTRQLFVTDAGSRLYQRYLRIVDELRQAQEELSSLQAEPMGHLRVSVPLALGGRRVAPLVPDFLKRHPKLTMELDLSVHTVDVLAEHFDVAVRIAAKLDDGLTAVRLAPYRRVFCASPAYLAERGIPRTPADLDRHECMVAIGAGGEQAWPMLQDGTVRMVPVRSRLVVNHGDAIYDAALAGLGICMQARWRVEDALRDGRLVEVLPEYIVQQRSIWAVLAQRGAMSPKVRVFVDFLRDALGDLH